MPDSPSTEEIITSDDSGDDSAPQSPTSDESTSGPAQSPVGASPSRSPFQRRRMPDSNRRRSNFLHRRTPDSQSNNPGRNTAEKLARKIAERYTRQAAMAAARAAAAAVFNVLIAIIPWLFIVLFVVLFFVIIIYYLSGKPLGGSASCINTSTASIAGGASSGLTLSHNDALNELTKAGANVVSSGNCSDKTNKTCTSLDGMRADTIATAVDLAKKSGGTIIVTGGTETGHAEGAESHGSGSKIDIGSTDGRSDKASQYIRSNYTFVGNRKGVHGGPIYEDPATGNQYVYETGLGHWDITVKSAPPGTTTAESTVPGADTGTGTDSTTGTTQTAGIAGADPCAPPPSSEDCNEKYASYMQRNPHDQSNFGDPQCDFTKEGLKLALEGVLPANTADLFYRVAGRESSYIPIIWTNSVGNVATPNSFGAWGLYQMGSRLKANNQYDRGDVIWRWQATNAVGYLRLLKGAGWRYWQAWRDLAGNTNYPI